MRSPESQIEDSESLRARILQEGSAFFDENRSIGEGAETKIAGHAELMEAYKAALAAGNYDQAVEFTRGADGEQIADKGRPVKDFLQGALGKYEMLANELIEKDPDQAADYRRRAGNARDILAGIEKLGAENG
jgi:hypothetical protein